MQSDYTNDFNGGCLASPYLSSWVIARLLSVADAESALHYVAQVSEKEKFVSNLSIVLSKVLLGVAIGLHQRLSILLAVIGVGVFGVCHGYAHGEKLPFAENQYSYAAGFMFTTACLYLTGAFGADIIQKRFNKGEKVLQLLGFATALVGCGLIFQL